MISQFWLKRKHDRRIREIGGRLDSSLQPKLSAWVDYLRDGLERIVSSQSKYLEHLGNRKIELVVTADREPNASVGMLDSKTYYIAIPIGLIQQLTSACSVVAFYKELWQGCRLANNEYISTLMLNEEFRRRVEGVRLLAENREAFIKKLGPSKQDEFLPPLTSAVIAATLSNVALYLVVRHELAHIMEGHLDVVIASRQAVGLTERLVMSPSTYFREIDADMSAALALPLWEKVSETQLFRTADEYYRCIAYSACTLFLVLGENAVQSDYDNMSHPFPLWRFRCFMDALDSRIDGTSAVLRDKIILQTMEAWVEFGLVRKELMDKWLEVLGEDADGALFTTLRGQA